MRACRATQHTPAIWKAPVLQKLQKYLSTRSLSVAHNSFQCLTESHKMAQFLLCASHLPVQTSLWRCAAAVLSAAPTLTILLRHFAERAGCVMLLFSSVPILISSQRQDAISQSARRERENLTSILHQSITRAIHTNKLNHSSAAAHAENATPLAFGWLRCHLRERALPEK